MDKRIKATEPTVKRIQPSEPTVRRLEPQTVAEALGGEPIPGHVKGRQGPLTLHVLREELLHRRPLADQVASVLLSMALRSVTQDQRAQDYVALIARELAAQKAEKGP